MLPALADTRTSTLLRRQQWLGWGVIALGLALFGLFIVLLRAMSDDAERLEASGTHTAGVVQEVRRNATRHGTELSLAVAYPVSDGRTTVGIVRLSDGGSDYVQGQPVDVVYDPAEPTHMTIAGASNDDPLLAFAAIYAFAASVLCAPLWLMLAWRRHRWRRVLARADWRPYDHVHAPVLINGGKQAIMDVTGPDEAPLLIRVSGLAGRLQKLASQPTVWLAQHEGRMVAATPGAASLYSARPPRHRQQQAKWRAQLSKQGRRPDRAPA